MDIWCWLKTNADTISALSTVVLTILTAAYVILTGRLSKTALSERQPAVWVDLEPVSGSLIRFVIGNDGPSGARNLRFDIKDTFDWESNGSGGKGVAGVQAIKQGIPYIPPGRVLKYHVGGAKLPSDKAQDKDHSVEIKLVFDSDLEKDIKRQFTFELSTYRGVLLQSFK